MYLAKHSPPTRILMKTQCWQNTITTVSISLTLLLIISFPVEGPLRIHVCRLGISFSMAMYVSFVGVLAMTAILRYFYIFFPLSVHNHPRALRVGFFVVIGTSFVFLQVIHALCSWRVGMCVYERTSKHIHALTNYVYEQTRRYRHLSTHT